MSEISRQIIDWYKTYKRDLPWRNTTDPYQIWLSEVILQQTRVAQGIAYYHRFLSRFPTVEALANAAEDHVLEIWQGLGYYSRARNMHAAARYVTFELAGKFPDSYDSLLKMKGIGSYTAAAIASFAYHEDKAVVDGNVIRVIARLFGLQGDVRQAKVVSEIQKITQSLLPPGNAYLFNQAIMELGALVCTPQNPKCEDCPVKLSCTAAKEQTQAAIPFKSKPKEKKERFLNYLLLEAQDELFFMKRGPKDIWEGLYEPLLVELPETVESPGQLIAQAEEKFQITLPHNAVVTPGAVHKHVLTHQLLQVHICHMILNTKPSIPFGVWVKKTDIEALPKPIIFSKIMTTPKLGQLTLSF